MSKTRVPMSWYDALTVNYRHRWSQGMELLASYTWSKYLGHELGERGVGGYGYRLRGELLRPPQRKVT